MLGLLCAFSTVEGCSTNCLCDELQTDCVVDSCDDRLPIEYTDFLRVTGKVCENRREFLNSLTLNTIIIMMSDSCVGLRNCQDDGHIKHLDEGKEETVTVTVEVLSKAERKGELAVPTQGVPFLPVETEDHANDGDNNNNNNDDNNGDNNGDNDGNGETTVEMTIETTMEITTEMTTDVPTEMTTERSTEQETTEIMAIVPYRTRNGNEDDHGSPSTSVTVYRR